MNLINNLFENWSKYEVSMEIILLLAILSISLLTIYLATKNRKILLLSSLSFIISSISNVLGILLVNSIFNIEITEVFRIVPVITAILLVSNLGILIGSYISKRYAKGFKISNIRKEYYIDSIKQTIFLLLLGTSTLLFLSVKTEAVISISILSTISSIWFTYWISKYILK